MPRLLIRLLLLPLLVLLFEGRSAAEPEPPDLVDAQLDFPIAMSGFPYRGPTVNVHWPEVQNPLNTPEGPDNSSHSGSPCPIYVRQPDGAILELLSPYQRRTYVNPVTGERTERDLKLCYIDLFPTFDGKGLLFSAIEVSSWHVPWDRYPQLGSDIGRITFRTYRDPMRREFIDLSSVQLTWLTNQELEPTTGTENWSRTPYPFQEPGKKHRNHGVYNLGPAPVVGPGGELRVIFTSDRWGYTPVKGMTTTAQQISIMDWDGKNVELVMPMSAAALHPTPLNDGRIVFSSWEVQGPRRSDIMWGVWASKLDGRAWEPIFSSFFTMTAIHFQTQLSNGDIAAVAYYNQNNNGFGALLATQSKRPTHRAPFGSPNARDCTCFDSNDPDCNGEIRFTYSFAAWRRGRCTNYPFITSYHNLASDPEYIPFSPMGAKLPDGAFDSYRESMYSLTQFANLQDQSAFQHEGRWLGKVTHPRAGANNDVYVTWCGYTPCTDQNRPTNNPKYHGMIARIVGGRPIQQPNQMQLVAYHPDFSFAFPAPIMPWKRIHGTDRPAPLEKFIPNDGGGHPQLPAGTPFGVLGTASMYNRGSIPGEALRNFDSPFKGYGGYFNRDNSSNWVHQGADTDPYDNSEIAAVRIIALELPEQGRRSTDFFGAEWFSWMFEKTRVLGEFPVRNFKPDGTPYIDGDGNPDTSWMALLPADQHFMLQMLDKDGLLLNSSQTWHQLRPGEVRNDCGGCHAHQNMPTSFAKTAAARSDYQVWDVARKTPLLMTKPDGKLGVSVLDLPAVDVEFFKHIVPILNAKCVSCHALGVREDGGLVLNDHAPREGRPYGNTYFNLATTKRSEGLASPYIFKQSSRRSYLAWKIFGRRLDGRTNADLPSPSGPNPQDKFDPEKRPPGTSTHNIDIDFVGGLCPPPASGLALTDEERRQIVRWIDLGAPVSYQQFASADDQRFRSYFTDAVRPTLYVSLDRRKIVPSLDRIYVGAFDGYSGIRPGSLSIKADFEVNGRPPGSQLATMLQPLGSDGTRYLLQLFPPLTAVDDGTIIFEVYDNQGNVARLTKTLTVSDDDFITPPKNLRITGFGFE